ncbi:MAG: glutaminyl-peptide cyclotransferase [Rikenellaceae bacterium]
MKIRAIKLILATLLIACSCVSAQERYKLYDYVVKATYPHSTSSYTQGLQIVDGELFEGTGMYGESKLLKVDLESGTPKTLATLPKSEFGEGITILGDTIYMLTWREGVMRMYHKESGEQIDTRRYSGEGWGLTSDGDKLYMSNGSSKITIRERESFTPTSSHTVTFNGQPIEYINELEWIDGMIWANIYMTDQIVIIDPKSWSTVGVVNLTGLLPHSERTTKTDVLNGIAYDEATKKIYVTGKYWSKLYEIEIIER